MNKLLLLRIKVLRLLLNIILIFLLQTKFLLYDQNICLNCFQIIRPIILAVKKVSFPQPRKISLIKEFFCSQRNFPWSRKFSTKYLIKEIFLSQGNFPQKNWWRKFSTKYLIKKIFHKIFDQGDFPQKVGQENFSLKSRTSVGSKNSKTK